MAMGTVFLIPLALVERPWVAIEAAGPRAWGALAYLAVAATVLSFLWWNMAIRRLGAGRTPVFSNLVPIVGVVLSAVVLGERLTPLQLVGGGLAVLGVVACQGGVPPVRRSAEVVGRDMGG